MTWWFVGLAALVTSIGVAVLTRSWIRTVQEEQSSMIEKLGLLKDLESEALAKMHAWQEKVNKPLYDVQTGKFSYDNSNYKCVLHAMEAAMEKVETKALEDRPVPRRDDGSVDARAVSEMEFGYADEWVSEVVFTLAAQVQLLRCQVHGEWEGMPADAQRICEALQEDIETLSAKRWG